jgi:argininosuccinate lyase
MSKDLLFWATRESGALHIDDSFIQISSIMPQKRNPVVLEHLRARLSRLLGLTQTVFIQCHNIPYGDTQDIEDEIEPTIFGAITTADDILDLYEAIFKTLQLNKEHLSAQAGAGFTTVTELADTLVREAHLSFRTAHQIVSKLVRRLGESKLSPEDITSDLLADVSGTVLPQPLHLSQQTIRRALDPVAFVQARTSQGGAAPAATAAVLAAQTDQLSSDEGWLAQEQQRLVTAEHELNKRVAQIVRAR